MEASFMSDATSQTVYFYNRHPISCEIILTKLRASRSHLDGLRTRVPTAPGVDGPLAASDAKGRVAWRGLEFDGSGDVLGG